MHSDELISGADELVGALHDEQALLTEIISFRNVLQNLRRALYLTFFPSSPLEEQFSKLHVDSPSTRVSGGQAWFDNCFHQISNVIHTFPLE
jgi:hypothetical protein